MKRREVGSEAPAMRLKMCDGSVKVVGMMADKVQAFVVVLDSVEEALLESIQKHHQKALIYLISPEEFSGIDSAFSSNDTQTFKKKMGVDEGEVALFIVSKDGEIVYKSQGSTLDIGAFDSALGEAIAFKKKGHTHENWMGV